MKTLILTTVLCSIFHSPPSLFAQEMSQEGRELLAVHLELIAAHVNGEVHRWMAIESVDYVSANQGRVTFPDWEERRNARASYLEGTEFEVYRDLRDPVIRISDDGSLGWLIAEVEVRGVTAGSDGEPESFHDIWAWVELYERTPDGWRLVGNVSNRRPGEGNGSGV